MDLLKSYALFSFLINLRSCSDSPNVAKISLKKYFINIALIKILYLYLWTPIFFESLRKNLLHIYCLKANFHFVNLMNKNILRQCCLNVITEVTIYSIVENFRNGAKMNLL